MLTPCPAALAGPRSISLLNLMRGNQISYLAILDFCHTIVTMAKKTPEKTTQPATVQDKALIIYKTRKQLFFDNLIAGIAWGLGSGIGATLVLALIGFLLARSQELPFVGQIIQNGLNTIQNVTQ